MELTSKEREMFEILISDKFRSLVHKLLDAQPVQSNILDKVIIPICREYNLTKDELTNSSRVEDLLLPRHLAIFILYTYEHLTGISKKEVLKFFNKKPHSRVDYVLNNTYERLKTDRRMRNVYASTVVSLKQK